MNVIHGRATIFFNGEKIHSEEDATLKPGGAVNRVRMVNGTSFRSQTVLPSEVTCSVPVTAQISLLELQALAGVEVQFASDTGVRYVIDSAAQTGDLSLQGGDNGGMVELTMSGNPAREVR